MAFDIHTPKGDDLANTQASCLPALVWNYSPTSRALTRSVLCYRAFREWNLANKHGLDLHSVLYGGDALSFSEVGALNLWIQGGGAMAAQNLSHFDSLRLFDRIRAG